MACKKPLGFQAPQDNKKERLSRSFLLRHNQGDQFHRLLAPVFQGVVLAEPGGADVAGMDRYLRSIVIEHRLAPEDIVELCLVLVVMIPC